MALRISLIFILLLSSSRLCPIACYEGPLCPWLQQSDAEIVVEVFTDPQTCSSRSNGHGPLELTGKQQHIKVFFTVLDVEKERGMKLVIWDSCQTVFSEYDYDQLVTAEHQSSEILMYAQDRWVGGHDNLFILQLLRADRTVAAQGSSHFTVPRITNVTEGLLGEMDQEGGGGCDEKDECFSHVRSVHWSPLACSQPRAPLRIFDVSLSRWSEDRLELFVRPGTGARREEKLAMEGAGMIRLRAQPVPLGDGSFCDHSSSFVAGTMLMAVGVTGGSVEHFGHFLLDYLFNLFRMHSAVHQDDVDFSWPLNYTCILDDMRETMSDLPKRKFYSTVNSICTRWLSLGELPDGSCFQRVILSFGSLELIRAADVSDVPLHVFRPECKHVVENFQRRILNHFGLKVGKAEEQREIIYLSRNDTGWRRMLNEHELVLKWNDKNPHYPMRSVSLHTMTMLDQLSLLQRTRVMIGINGGQINALFLLPPGSTCASVFAMRWTDQNFGYVYHSWLKLRGVRYIQFDITQGGTTNLDWLSFAKYSDDWSSSMRAIRDADMSMPYEHFHEFVHAALDPTVSKFDSTDSPAELSKLLHHFEREQRL